MFKVELGDQDTNDLSLNNLPKARLRQNSVVDSDGSRTHSYHKLFSQTTLQDAGLAEKTIATATEKRKLLSKLDEEVAKKTEKEGGSIFHEYWSEHADDKKDVHIILMKQHKPPHGQNLIIKWLKAESDDGRVYYYHEETRQTAHGKSPMS